MSDQTPEPTDQDVPEVVAHADDGEGYPCSVACNQMAAD